MQLLGLHILDVIIIVGSLISILAVGAWVSRGVKHENDFFVGGRRMGPVLSFFLNFGSFADSNGAPTVATTVYRQGAGGMWLSFWPLFNTPFYWFIAVWWRRTRLITAQDQFIERLNSRRLAMGLAWWGVLIAPLGGALGNIVSYKVASAMFVKPESAYTQVEAQQISMFKEYQSLNIVAAAGKLTPQQQDRYKALDSLHSARQLHSYVSYLQKVPFFIVYTLIVCIYIMLGGIKAAAYTDAIQGVLIIIFSFMLIPMGLREVGGLTGLHQKVPEFMFNLMGSTSAGDYAWYSILALIIMGIAGNACAQGCGTAKDEKTARIGLLGGAFGKRLIMVAWMFCALLAVAIFPANSSMTIADPDNAWGTMSRHLLGPGFLGLMIAGILLGHMPGVGAGAVNFAATFTRNLYEPLLPGRSSRHYMMVAKIAIFFVLAIGVVAAMFFDGIESLMTLMVSIGVFFGATGLLMLFWRRLSARAVGVTWIVWMIFLMVIPWTLPRLESFRRNPSLLLETPTRTVQINAPGTREDVLNGKATKVGEVVKKDYRVAPAAVFFESIARSNPSDLSSPREGKGRFHVENYILWSLGVRQEGLSTPALNTCRWLVDTVGPYFLLVLLSYLLPDKKKLSKEIDQSELLPVTMPVADHSQESISIDALVVEEEVEVVLANQGIPDPETYAQVVMRGNIALLYNPNETAGQAKVRMDRYFAKFKTPIAATPELDEEELVKTFRDPTRFDHLKMFPDTNWEFTKWTRGDVIGFTACWAGVVFVVSVLWLVLNVGV